jgi:hypothetical protein
MFAHLPENGCITFHVFMPSHVKQEAGDEESLLSNTADYLPQGAQK